MTMNSVNCPNCAARIHEDASGLQVGGFMAVCWNCGKAYMVSRSTVTQLIEVEPYDGDGDDMIQGIIDYNYHQLRQARGLE